MICCAKTSLLQCKNHDVLPVSRSTEAPPRLVPKKDKGKHKWISHKRLDIKLTRN